jgi:hypothetical protein
MNVQSRSSEGTQFLIKVLDVLESVSRSFSQNTFLYDC